ncbi:uncharacterized protein EI97DRAFT_458362 [Westerdykella ornata]|uniref:Uncharacterized protein n=1 Tax=Westerdykella ornata TaxID=318751 RepID=A0A6A6JIZ3_WESOR|nr:uncharacterized protein EI97DRAFT_458362 [Westerdykella ornata]KAF2276427.1 hypothetical protein EI97DRAFT_458362 [Westerdykella ornata]
MVLPRPTALRASTFARYARPARHIRAAEFQPGQRMLQKRTYASRLSSSGLSKQSDMPWMIGAVAATAGGLYLVMSQDTSHGEGHGGHGQHHDPHDKIKAGHEEEAPAVEEAKEEKEEPAAEEKEEETPKEEKEEVGEATKKPSDTDKPHPSKEPASTNEQSGKQDATYSNQDAHHPPGQDVTGSEDKSKKGEGAAETAKLKGTVSPERPPAENKEEQGKTEVDKNA